LNALIAFSGVVTVVPLIAFTLSLRRLPLLAISFIQFLSPTVQMLIAVTLLGESLTADRVAAFGCVWVAVGLFIGDAVWQARAMRRAYRAAAAADAIEDEVPAEEEVTAEGRGFAVVTTR
jgi:chloramphenicol-sensitive protein RarD